MPRVFMILAGATLAIFIGLFYQYSVQQKNQAELAEYEMVLEEKTQQIAEQAQNWSTPIQLEIEDERLDGDYAIMAEFVLGQLRDSAEERNQYLRELKAANWQNFLNIDRLAQDQTQGYTDTEAMLKQVHQIVNDYQQKIQQRDAELIDKAQQLDIKNRYRQQLTQNLKDSQQNSNAHVIFEIEKQSLAKADALFALLKQHKWQKKNQIFMFYEDKAVKEFNALYKDMLDLNRQMQQVASANQKAVENKL
ncbi:hypothetical protein NI467_10345 [Acinetobacter bohemicus]|uniref:hypothetical protein n=1 Tax=Acinetobacter sp. S4397-1 TaxID=2972915 RepID=UPI00209B8D8C|nr:hypothetical protein [Acinetobacter sp. S4397-1]MCO8045743.1 hypothetical protein [Acinetobacter sp. S4397-1]